MEIKSWNSGCKLHNRFCRTCDFNQLIKEIPMNTKPTLVALATVALLLCQSGFARETAVAADHAGVVSITEIVVAQPTQQRSTLASEFSQLRSQLKTAALQQLQQHLDPTALLVEMSKTANRTLLGTVHKF